MSDLTRSDLVRLERWCEVQECSWSDEVDALLTALAHIEAADGAMRATLQAVGMEYTCPFCGVGPTRLTEDPHQHWEDCPVAALHAARLPEASNE